MHDQQVARSARCPHKQPLLRPPLHPSGGACLHPPRALSYASGLEPDDQCWHLNRGELQDQVRLRSMVVVSQHDAWSGETLPVDFWMPILEPQRTVHRSFPSQWQVWWDVGTPCSEPDGDPAEHSHTSHRVDCRGRSLASGASDVAALTSRARYVPSTPPPASWSRSCSPSTTRIPHACVIATTGTRSCDDEAAPTPKG
jgi:hypothetical protein